MEYNRVKYDMQDLLKNIDSDEFKVKLLCELIKDISTPDKRVENLTELLSLDIVFPAYYTDTTSKHNIHQFDSLEKKDLLKVLESSFIETKGIIDRLKGME